MLKVLLIVFVHNTWCRGALFAKKGFYRLDKFPVTNC